MAKFTVDRELGLDWRGQALHGVAGTIHRIPDALYDEFIAEFITGKDGLVPSHPMPSLTWVEDDEIGASGGAHPDLGTHDAMGLATDAELTTHANAADPHAGYALDADLTNHEAAADPHAGYRLESADHTHATSGLQGGQVAYSSLTGTPAAERAAASTTPATIGTAAVGTGTTDARADHVHATGAGTPSTQAFGDAAATGSGPAAAMTDHKHAFPALGTTPSTQAFADAAAGGSATTPSKNDHKHAMPTLGYGLSGNSTPVVGLSQTSAFATATTSISAATYADITGASISLAAGTWLIVAQVFGAAANLAFLMHTAITDGANAILSEGSQFVPASGTASVNAWGGVALHAIVAPGSTTTYKLRAARGLTTLTNTWVAQDGSGVNVTNNASDNTDKGTGLFAIRIA